MRPRVNDQNRPSREIDERVLSARGRGESLYTLDIDLLRSLDPDLLLTQNLCGVCSVTEAEVAAACARAGVTPRVVSLAPTNLGEVWDSIETVGRELHDADGAGSLATSLRDRTRVAPTSGRTVAVVEWLDPPILAGLWTPDLITAAGGISVGPRRSQPGVRTTWPELARSSPDLLVLSPCSFAVERTIRELRSDPRLMDSIRGVQPRLGSYVADEAYFSRPGPRLAAGAELIHTLLSGGPPFGPMPVEPLSAVRREVSA